MTEEQRVEAIAAAMHSAWYAYTVLGLGEDGEQWRDAPDWQKRSLRDAVRFHDGLPACSTYSRCAQSHANWMSHKEAEGWVYGEVKDADAKTHPCMVPYGDLPLEQRLKDEVVVAAYRAMIDVLGWPS